MEENAINPRNVFETSVLGVTDVVKRVSGRNGVGAVTGIPRRFCGGKEQVKQEWKYERQRL